jgi:hypothetical protein
MSDFKPIQTRYKGYYFRSRLEARWAVFFDAVGAKYEYEPEGYVFRNGSKYLVDFFVTGFAENPGYFEVKPHTIIEQKWIDNGDFLSEATGNDFYILNGPPDFKSYKGLRRLDPTEIFEERECFNVSFMRQVAKALWLDATDPFSTTKDFLFAEKLFTKSYRNGVNKARAARF